ncbi:SPOR and LysM peptidoglycan-binding domain-containing protein [Moraxella porci]|uniref:SPOR and LysM peptidoglycan-binding domain-containing protein n=1 Tax=Moraxella porci TaxID=1288392 RepID=UPI00244C65BD|nr:LysM peptidoglycan-binding domain-containing protein [Moraxella porci]MDH2274304.1 LysM peptidoglycan-binding domain-containing protein [Moraxella porci]
MVSKQVMLGVALIIGGSVAFFALAKNDSAADAAAQAAAEDTTTTKVAKPVVQPLTADVATEERLLAEKQRAREAHNLQMQKQAAALLEEQNNARKQALDKANAEATGRPLSNTQEVSADSAAKSELIAAPTVQTRPEAIEAARKAEEAKKAEEAAKKAEQAAKSQSQQAKAQDAKKTDDNKADTKSDTKEVKAPAKAGTYEVQAGETWQGIANRHGVSVAALAEANGMTRHDLLRAGRSIKIPSASQVARLERDNKAREAKAKQEAAKSEASKSSDTTKNKSTEKSDTKKSDTKTETKPQNPQMSGRYTVQVAISPDKEKVDEIVKQYRAAGYRVTTSSTSRGLRVLVGNEKSEEGAKALRKKIADDSRVSAPGAFVHQVQ